MSFYIIGIDGRCTVDPQYFYDRWECIEAGSEKDALDVYCNDIHVNWIRSDERELVGVYDVLDSYISPRVWIKNNH